MTPAERTERLSHLKDEMRKLEVLFEETEIAFGHLTEEEKLINCLSRNSSWMFRRSFSFL
jgi:hypothetical protein